MLSRIAESLYWIGRYTERAESTARILDVYTHSVLEDRRGEEESACIRLLDALGAGDAAAVVGTDFEALIAFVVNDPRYPGSIAHSLEAAWANARGAREAISSEMWESINTTHATLAARRGGSAFVTPDDPRVVAAASVLTQSGDPCSVVVAASAWTRDHLGYESGATDVSTTSSGALDIGRGVCQDFVHVAIALLRACGIPARYASGYLHPHEDARIGNTVTGQSHAWLEAWLGEWDPIDPTSGAEVGERHVLVARGRDYGDVAPLKGVFHGPPDLSVDVRVAIERVA
jgi:transglutaminase-like putative cysteine protease